MRTTVTLDRDVEVLLRKAMRERGISFKEALNQAIRAGMARPESHRRRGRFRMKTYRMGFNPNLRWDKALMLAGEIEDEETAHKLQLGK